MPVEVGFWKIDGQEIKKIEYSTIDNERKLEDILFKDISILGDDYLLIGRQIRTSYGKIIDLLSIDSTGKITILELKKEKTPREVVAQADHVYLSSQFEKKLKMVMRRPILVRNQTTLGGQTSHDRLKCYQRAGEKATVVYY